MPQSQIATRIQELAIQGANAGLTPEARAAISGEMGALQKEFERIGNATSIGSNTLADGGALDVIADDTGSVIAQELPPMGPTAANLSGVDTAPPAAAISFASSALSSTLSARAQLGTYDNIYARAESNLAQSMENHVQALSRMNAAAKDQQPDSPLGSTPRRDPGETQRKTPKLKIGPTSLLLRIRLEAWLWILGGVIMKRTNSWA